MFIRRAVVGLFLIRNECCVFKRILDNAKGRTYTPNGALAQHRFGRIEMGPSGLCRRFPRELEIYGVFLGGLGTLP